MKTLLHISPDLDLPLEAVVQTFAVLAKRGSGKTYTGAVIAEEMIEAKQAVTIIDPVGVWWGLRAGANNKDEGLDVLVMGGDHGDVPLERTGGEMVAEFIVEARRPVVLDLSLFRKGEQTQFVTDFAETLYRRNRAPMHVFVDEADAFAPQRPMPNESRMLGAMEDLVRRGRARGIGLTLITQRAAVLNKNVLTQIEVLICLRTISPQDRAAIESWIEVHGTEEERDELMESLPSLPIGTAWFWSPGWLNKFQKVQVRKRRTFDSSATPKAGEKITQPKKLRPVDLAELRDKMAATIETALANDPRELRRQLAKLHKTNAELQSAAANVEPPKPAITDGQIELLRGQAAYVGAQISQLKEVLADISEHTLPDLVKIADSIMIAAAPAHANMQNHLHNRIPHPQPAPRREPAHPRPGLSTAAGGDTVQKVSMGGGVGRMMVALAQCPRGLTQRQLGVRAGMSSRSGTFSNYLAKLRTNGWAEGRESMKITSAGVEALGNYDPLPTGKALLEYWLGELGSGGLSRMLRVLAEAYPNPMTRASLGALAQISPESGTFSNYLAKLRTLELVQDVGRDLRASEEFFTQ